MRDLKLVVGGMPTEPDVKRLIEAFPSPKIGEIITHQQIVSVIGAAPGSTRYRTVVTAWRRQLFRQHNIDTKAVPGIGIAFLTASERVTESIRGYSAHVRGIRRDVRRIRSVRAEELTDQQQRATEHATRHMEATLSQARTDSKAIAVQFTPQAQLPRVKPKM